MTLRCAGPSRQDPTAGFTLLEALVTVTVLVLIAAALAGFGGQPPAQHDDAVRAMVSTLRAARAEAVRTRAPVAVVFDAENRRYGIGTPDRENTVDIALVAQRAARMGDFPAIRFFPDGSSSGGVVNLNLEGQSAEITVRWVTGRISHE